MVIFCWTDDLASKLLLRYLMQKPSSFSSQVNTAVNEKKELEVKGLLGAIGWGADDSVTRIALFTANEDVYELEVPPEKNVIRKHLRREVIVKGPLIESRHGMKAIQVADYKLVEANGKL